MRARFVTILVSALRDCRGTSAVEFALIAPPLLLAFFGIIEIAVVLFISTTIEAAVFDASRFGVIGGVTPGQTRAERVLEIIGERTYGLVDLDQMTLDTLVYDSFADIGKPEPFTDDNGNGAHDAGEPFTDVNGNGSWDPDMGLAGLGGPGDIVVYRVRYAWGVLTPMMRNVLGESVEHASSVAVRNEPF